ncbi:uncharacterized protein LOC6561062 [Drosophila grimshawi]|uniref:uncharacterized protein LOC6561062 n=1 Tax=Drosophila grimshawi TaxID=7222 RepID=UPI001C931C36|nr:uncharacterized protein LOC6561062 [Drosophila grimshawi]
MRPIPDDQTREASAVYHKCRYIFRKVVRAIRSKPETTFGCCSHASSAESSVMECRSVPILPTYAESCVHSSDSKKASLCQTLFPNKTLRETDPAIILITLAVVVGSFCLLSGFILLCAVSKSWQDETSEAVLLMGIGFLITSLACVTWKLTNAQRLAQLQETISIY